MHIDRRILLLVYFLLPFTTRAQPPPLGDDLQVDHLSVYSTLASPSGVRRVSVSFRVTNRGGGLLVPSPSKAEIALGATTVDLGIPALGAQVSAYVSTTIETTTAQIPITIQVIPQQIVVSRTNGQTTRTSRVQLRATQVTVQPSGDFGRWESIGPSKIDTSPPDTGRVTTIAVDPRNPFVVYAGARGSGLWKSSGSSMSWFPVTDALPTAEIDAVTIDPGNPDRIVISTPLGVFQSLNGGAVWTQTTNMDLQASGSDGGAFLISPTNGAMYASTPVGVQISTDRGAHWTNILGNGVPASSLQFSTTDPTHLFATLGPPLHSVFEAINGGLTFDSWHRLEGCPAAPLPRVPGSSNLWVAESAGTMWISYRSGKADNDKVGLWRTTSAMCTVNGFPEHEWQQVSLPSPCGDFTNQWSYLYADPLNPGNIYKAGIKLCHSSGSGDGMAQVDNIHDDQHAIAVAPSNAKVLYYGSDGGIYRSVDSGASLSFIGEGMSNTEFLNIDVDGHGVAVVGGSQDNGTETWNDLGSPIWSYVAGTGDSSLVALDRGDSGQIYEIGQSMRQIAHRPFNGDADSIGDGSLPDCCSYSEFPASVLEGMVSTGGSPGVGLTCHGIWSGPPWKQIQPPLGPQAAPSQCEGSNPGDFTRLKFFPGGLGIWVGVTNTGHVFYGIYNQPPPADVFHPTIAATPAAITFVNQSIFYVAMNTGVQGAIYRLECLAGCTAENAWAGNPAGEITAVSTDPLAPDALLAAVRNAGVFRGTRTAPGVWTWSPYNNGMPFAVTVTDLEPRLNGSVVAATYGRGAFLSFSRSTTPPNPSARGHVTSLTAERIHPDRPPGRLNPILLTVELDSKPGFLFSSVSPGGTFVTALRQAQTNNRLVTITYVSSGANSGRIVGVSAE